MRPRLAAPVDQVDGVRDGSLDMAIVRLPVDRDGLHCVRLYDEVQVAVASREHLLAAADEEVTTDDLVDEQLVRPHSSGWRPSAEQLDWPAMTEQEAIETVAAGTGIVILPMSVARLHQRKDVVTRVVSDLDPTTIALVWKVERDDEEDERRRKAEEARRLGSVDRPIDVTPHPRAADPVAPPPPSDQTPR